MSQNKLDTPVLYPTASNAAFEYKFRFLPWICLLGIVVVITIADLTFIDRHFWLYTVIYHHLHPVKRPIIPGAVGEAMPLNLIKSLPLTCAFVGLFSILFTFYFLAVRFLPRLINQRYIFRSTILMGIAYILLPVVTSQDIFSYIAYARMAVLYHLNPMVVAPTAIKPDFVYGFLYWVNQPSVYGPTWLAITSLLQIIASVIGFKYVLSMELLLRIFGFMMHLGSTQLVWILSAQLRSSNATVSEGDWQRRRLRTTLAFAWNPFLLLEACVNAHNDITILFMLLLSLWFLIPHPENKRIAYVSAIIILALLACLKISYIVLLPGILLFILLQGAAVKSLRTRILQTVVSIIVYSGLIIGMHAPFWDHGALLNVLQVTPSASRNTNSFYETVVNIYASFKGIPLTHKMDHGSRLEIMSHMVSTGLFLLIYAAICIRSICRPRYINTWPALVAWLAFTWLLYCVVGSPWFWPWYTIILFGLFALLEVNQEEQTTRREPVHFVFGALDVALFGRLLSVSMVSLYCLWIFYNLVPNFQFTYFTSVFVWGIPFLIIGMRAAQKHIKQKLLYIKPSLDNQPSV
ncbi:hypothetical protein KDA_64580 [Dictyobacter alpinus]|uniref:Glycosyltransferase RgtA/B/C/D-like domain-containing protein n=1 Tax=Dictyobacter alpinus TaxID=2014873 RepID=A0A402BHT5_9CHLR|nr:hypothetical protein [Dictyobacter alpinus]GCE30974.1 hypothetical protein KDA_64580 [Dictyobacter alpinus]